MTDKIRETSFITQSQWRYVRHWLVLIVFTECILLWLHDRLVFAYLAIALLFLAGLTLRVLRLYPGQREPLALDFLAVILSLGFAGLAYVFEGSPWRFLMIGCSSLIVFPHFVFILREK